jgi:hypothetical protein
MPEYFDPPDTQDTYRHARSVRFTEDEVGIEVLTPLLPERVGYVERDDTAVWICSGNERLADIAVAVWAETFDKPHELWEALQQFQPEPYIDPSVPLPIGKTIYIPSVETLQETFFGDSLALIPRL